MGHAPRTEPHPQRGAAQGESESHGSIEATPLSRAEEGDEMLLMGLRLAEGVDLDRLAGICGSSPSPAAIATLARQGLLETFSGKHGEPRLRATRNGRFILNEIVLRLAMSFTGRAPDRNWAKHLLEEVGLSERLHYKPEKLSVGQQQRVAVARALANRPKLVLADEPTGALDVNNAQQVLELIRTLCAEVQASLLLVSHDLNIARQLPRVVELAALNGNRSVTKPE